MAVNVIVADTAQSHKLSHICSSGCQGKNWVNKLHASYPYLQMGFSKWYDGELHNRWSFCEMKANLFITLRVIIDVTRWYWPQPGPTSWMTLK